MNLRIERIRKAIWTYKQPLTKMPSNPGSPVSDLFFWRNSTDWSTWFELVDTTGLFIDDNAPRYANFMFFNLLGIKLHEEKVKLVSNKRNTIELSKCLSNIKDEVGTFCVFHSKTAEQITEQGSFLTERGYIAYQYRNSPVRSYVHGNYDAVCQTLEGKIDYLGGIGILPREYRVQYEFDGKADYDLVFVNPTSKKIKITCVISSLKHPEKSHMEQTKNVLPGGASIFEYDRKIDASYRVIVKSRLVMPRPVVIQIKNDKIDVFHG